MARFESGQFILEVATQVRWFVIHGPDKCKVRGTGEPGYCLGDGAATVIPASEVEAEGAFELTNPPWHDPKSST